jgi:hypothetical protein
LEKLQRALRGASELYAWQTQFSAIKYNINFNDTKIINNNKRKLN